MLEDLRVNGWSSRPCCMVAAYRIARSCSVWRKKDIINNLWVAPVLVMYHLITERLFGYEIQAAILVGRHFIIHRGYGVVINKNVVAGDDFTLCHSVIIGSLGANDPSYPAIDNGAESGVNVTLLDDVTIGDNVTTGAGSVVVDSIPDSTLVVSERARVKVIK